MRIERVLDADSRVLRLAAADRDGPVTISVTFEAYYLLCGMAPRAHLRDRTAGAYALSEIEQLSALVPAVLLTSGKRHVDLT